MICLVTGATGFVGSAVARKLIAAGHQVRVLARAESDRSNLADLPVELVQGSLAEPASLPPAVDGVEAIFHVAADYRLWVPDEELMYRTNVEGTVALMEAALAAGVKRIVHTSSVATLGLLPRGQDADEATPVSLSDMIGPYKRSKFLAEECVQRLVRERGLPAVIVNPSTPIGPRDIKPTPTGRIIVESAKGKIPAYVETGLNVVHVDDVAAGHLLARESGKIGERYILGGDNMRLADILRHVAGRAGRSTRLVRLPRLPLFPIAVAAETIARFTGKEPMTTIDGLKMARWHMWFSSEKAERELGYRHRGGTHALDDALDWFRKEGYC